MNELTMRLEADPSRPLYEQIYGYIREDIRKGQLPCGKRLPSTRKLADFLEVSRSTVTLAYEQLLSEGYIENRPRSGYYVSDLEGLYRLPESGPPAPKKRREEKRRFCYDFSPSGVDLQSFPHHTWRKIAKSFLLEDNQDFYQLGAPEGEEELREIIASYVHQARGVECSAEQVVVGAGNDYLLMLLGVLLNRDAVYAFEDPTYRKAFEIFCTLGKETRTVAADASGMEVEALEKSGADVAYIMPSHQYPLGTVMPAKRRLALLGWAFAREGRFLIEDDYDSEFRYRGKPIPALQGFDTAGKVIYIGTFSKSIAPAIRISFLILPQTLLMRYRDYGRRFSSTVSRMDQKILAEFIRGGYYERHLNRMRSIYKGRHDALLETLRKYREDVEISGEYAGTHILLTLKNTLQEKEAIRLAAEAGVYVQGLSSCCIQETLPRTTLILGYANMDEKHVCAGAKVLLRALLSKT